MKINIMTIICFIAVIFAVISLGCYEGGIDKEGSQGRTSYHDFFESAVVIGGLISLIFLILTAIDKPKALAGRAYIFLGLCAILLLVAVVLVTVYAARNGRPHDIMIASYVFAAFEFAILMAGWLAPLIYGL